MTRNCRTEPFKRPQEQREQIAATVRAYWGKRRGRPPSNAPDGDPERGLSYLDRGNHCTFEESFARVRDRKRKVANTDPLRRGYISVRDRKAQHKEADSGTECQHTQEGSTSNGERTLGNPQRADAVHQVPFAVG